MLTQARLKELFHYDPFSGLFLRKVGVKRCKKGSVAGSIVGNGYVEIQIDKRKYLASRLAFLWMTGKWPVNQVDHRNRIRSDNRWSNLREATRQQNGHNQNLNARNTSGFRGVTKHPHGRWGAYLKINGKQKHLGYFDTPEEAGKAAEKARRLLYGEFS